VNIRPAEERDRSFILRLAPRLIEFGEVPGRDPSDMVERDRAALARTLDGAEADAALFIAEGDGTPLGFIHLATAHDYYTDSVTAHVADIVVAPEASGQGVGRALLEYAEQWGRDKGFAILTLNVFIANQDARGVYRTLGFQEEWIRCVKRL
jgi:GNAT superfamily N-acetyltransferase